MFWNRKKHELIEQLDGLQKQVEKQAEEIGKLKDQNEQVERILTKYIPGKITGNSRLQSYIYRENGATHWGIRHDAYVYVDGKEYIFDDLHLKNPVFTQGSQKNIIYVTDTDDKDNCNSYVLDTNSRTYIQTRNEQKYDRI